MTEIPIRVLNLDIDNEEVEDVLMETLGAFLVTGSEKVCTLSIFVEHGEVIEQAVGLVRELQERLPEATFLNVDRDLVGSSQIAQRIGVSREAVRKWTHSQEFPTNQANLDGQGKQLWAWTQIVDWVEQYRGLDLEEALPTLDEMTAIDFGILPARKQSKSERHSLAGTYGARWHASTKWHSQGMQMGGTLQQSALQPTGFVEAA